MMTRRIKYRILSARLYVILSTLSNIYIILSLFVDLLNTFACRCRILCTHHTDDSSSSSSPHHARHQCRVLFILISVRRPAEFGLIINYNGKLDCYNSALSIVDITEQVQGNTSLLI